MDDVFGTHSAAFDGPMSLHAAERYVAAVAVPVHQDVREAAEWIQKLLTEILLRYSAGDHSGFDDGSPFDR
jgi:hypothetical protein